MRGLAKLLRLAELRQAMAERTVSARRADLQAAEAKLESAKENKLQVERDVERRRNLLREAFVGSVHARRAVEEMMLDMTGLEDMIEQAKQDIETARQKRDDAIPPYKDAQKALAACRAVVTKRQELLDQEKRAARIAFENAADAEIEEQWVGQNFHARAGAL